MKLAGKLARPIPCLTVGEVLGDLAKRVVNGAVLFVAVVAFFLVPFGRRTLAQHAAAIVGTPPAREAATACADAGRRVVERAGDEWRALRKAPPPAPPAPDLPPAD
jgi:hypothetical protein